MYLFSIITIMNETAWAVVPDTDDDFKLTWGVSVFIVMNADDQNHLAYDEQF